METLLSRLNIYIIPPLLSLMLGWTLAILTLIKGKLKSENILFALVCIWMTLMAPIFISHHLLKGDFQTIMIIERSIHCLYVYLPLIYLLYLHKAFGFNNRKVIIVTAVICFILSLAVWTPHYFSGFYIYRWGYSGRGGVAFKIFGAYGFAIIVYMIFFLFRKIKASDNQTEKLKLMYINLSFLSTVILTLLNVPAISGIDFYPFGNFMFIPLTLLAYGVLKYRLMEIRSVLHISFIWTLTSSIIIIPNALFFYYMKPFLLDLSWFVCFSIFIAWFMMNYAYLKFMQPLIDRLFNKQKYNLLILERRFIENIALLRTLDDLSYEFTGVIKKALNVKRAELYIKAMQDHQFADPDGAVIETPPGIEDWFSVMNHLVEIDMVKTNPYYDPVRDDLVALFQRNRCQYIVPLVQNNQLMGLLMISERANLRQLNSPEIRFINNIRSTVSISVSNSILYQDLANLKDNLEEKVEQRTEDLLRAKEEVETINIELSETNEKMEAAKNIAEMDMAMAVQVQKSLFPRTIPESDDWDIAMEFQPLSGVSGDIYDFYSEDSRLLGMTILDVSGHGIASGLITVIARSVMHRHFFLNRSRRLNEIINEVNRELITEISASNKYLSGIVLRFRDNIIEYVNAGHPDLIMKKKKSGNARIVAPRDGEDFKGTFLGVEGMSDHFNMIKFMADPGDCIVVFTDCIIESQNGDGIPYGMKRILQSISDTPGGTARDVLNGLMADFRTYIGDTPIIDDLTVIVAQKIDRSMNHHKY